MIGQGKRAQRRIEWSDVVDELRFVHAKVLQEELDRSAVVCQPGGVEALECVVVDLEHLASIGNQNQARGTCSDQVNGRRERARRLEQGGRAAGVNVLSLRRGHR